MSPIVLLVYCLPLFFLIMACSKSFFEDLPELTNYVIQYLRNDLQSLYSCILVNRSLCRITIPILWEDPFSVKIYEDYSCNCNLLDTYLLFFNEDDKKKLKEFGITINSPSFKNPLFNYPSFIKKLSTSRVGLHIVNWINNLDTLPDTNSKSTCSKNQVKSDKMIFLSANENMNLGIKKDLFDSMKTRDFIFISLFKSFINNNASLNHLITNTNYCPKIYEIISDNSKFISEIEKFTFTILDSFRFQHSLSSLLCDEKRISSTDLVQSQAQLLFLSFHFIPINVDDIFKYCFNTLTL